MHDPGPSLYCQILSSQQLRRANIASILCQAACKNVAYLGSAEIFHYILVYLVR